MIALLSFNVSSLLAAEMSSDRCQAMKLQYSTRSSFQHLISYMKGKCHGSVAALMEIFHKVSFVGGVVDTVGL